jgi:segregation and condensation protein B
MPLMSEDDSTIPDAAEPIEAGPDDRDAHAESSPAGDVEPAPIDPEHDLAGKVEAALLTADRAFSSAKLGEALGGAPAKRVKETIDQLNQQYADTGRSFRIEAVAGGWKVLTLPQYANVLQALHKSQAQQKLSPAALETLAIIAYKQPILRADLEAIRGVACGEVLRSLMDRHLVKITGRAEEIGRPMLYGTTKAFLEVFGLSSVKDLPSVDQLTAGE